MQFIRPALFAALVALSACSPKREPPPVVDMASLPCASRIALGGAVPLLFDPRMKEEKTTTAILDGRSNCIKDANGRRLYQVFALPDAAIPYIISVRSSPWADTILAPSVLFLDGDGKSLRSTNHADFVFRGEQLSALVRSHQGEAYLVVTSDSEVLGREITRVVDAVHSAGTVLPGGGFLIWYSGSDVTNHLALSPVGRAEVTIVPFPADGKK